MNTDHRFIESLPEVPASAIQAVELNVANYEDAIRLIDGIIKEIAKNDDYAKIMSIYTTAQMYGKNCTVDSLMHTFTNAYKAFAKQESVLAIDLLSKNILNSNACIESHGKLKKEIFTTVILGYAASIIAQQNS